MNRKIRAVVIAVVALAVLSFLPAITIPDYPRRWIDPSWVEGIATFWALLGAGVVIFLEIQRDIRDSRREQQQRERQSALDEERLVADFAGGFAFLGPEDEDDDENGHTIIVANYGRYPVWMFVIDYRWTVSENGQKSVKSGSVISPPVVRPGESEVVMVSIDRDVPVLVPYGSEFTISFNSANGKRYERTLDGMVSQVPRHVSVNHIVRIED